jgi:hypothetical protein
MATAAALCTEVLRELQVLQANESASASDATATLGIINLILDAWNAERDKVYADQQLTFTLTQSLNPHTIGPTGATWTTSQRPVSIAAANLVIDTIRYGINIRDRQWYTDLTLPELSTQQPTDLFYDPSWGNGKLYMYPVPDAAYDVELWVRIVLAGLSLDDDVSMPPGYHKALKLTAAEDAASLFGVPVSPDLIRRASNARAVIAANNVTVPTLATRDAGMPSGRGGWFNYYTGRVE